MKWPSLFTRNRPLPKREAPRSSSSDAEIESLQQAANAQGGRLRNEVQAVQSASRLYSRRLNLMADTLALKGAYHEAGSK